VQAGGVEKAINAGKAWKKLIEFPPNLHALLTSKKPIRLSPVPVGSSSPT
jgi:hypothetical protein